jgi:hypothetical protein
MESIKKLLRTPSALALIIVAIISLVGVVIQSNSSKAAARLPIDAASTAEAKQQANAFPVDIPIAISAQKGWQKTGIPINIGDKVDIAVVDGKWTVNRYSLSSSEKACLDDDYKKYDVYVYWSSETGGEGLMVTCVEQKPNIGNCQIPDSPWGRLIARIGLNNPFDIGQHSTFVSTYSGVLELRMNIPDERLDYSSGMLAVIIKVEKP